MAKKTPNKFTTVTPFSKFLAVALFIAFPFIGFFLGTAYQSELDRFQVYQSKIAVEPTPGATSATYDCSGGRSIKATYAGDMVSLALSDSRKVILKHAMAADGARYANQDESFVFWTRGNTAFITEGSLTTYKDCIQQ